MQNNKAKILEKFSKLINKEVKNYIRSEEDQALVNEFNNVIEKIDLCNNKDIENFFKHIDYIKNAKYEEENQVYMMIVYTCLVSQCKNTLEMSNEQIKDVALTLLSNEVPYCDYKISADILFDKKISEQLARLDNTIPKFRIMQSILEDNEIGKSSIEEIINYLKDYIKIDGAKFPSMNSETFFKDAVTYYLEKIKVINSNNNNYYKTSDISNIESILEYSNLNTDVQSTIKISINYIHEVNASKENTNCENNNILNEIDEIKLLISLVDETYTINTNSKEAK